ncbi:MAG TPA: hypothetical protein VFU27_01680 [Terriglobales bacterium]|nr:hypothetical protein [Terriglobales bacterium]
MKGNHAIVVCLLLLLLTNAAWSRIFLRWTQPDVPPVATLAVNGLAIPWGSRYENAANRARQLGYDVYLEVPLSDAPAAAAAPGTSGIMLDPGSATQAEAENLAARLRRQHPGLSVLVVDRGAKQPQMRGHSIITRNGVLETSSRTEQPWLDCNLALVRYDRVIQPQQVPLYQFDWELDEPLQQKEGPTAAAYTLAVAEAGAFHADVILSVPDDLQARLAQGEPAALSFWSRIQPYLGFAKSAPQGLQPEAEVGVVPDTDYTWFEPANLLARHNIPFHVVLPEQLNNALGGLKVLVIFATPTKGAAAEIQRFASNGGTAVLVGTGGAYPWHAMKAVESSASLATYSVGNGHIIELLKPVDDPDTFAADIRRLLENHTPTISLWNALTTIAVPYENSKSDELEIELVNYAQDPVPVQFRVKGAFGSIRYETPENGCCGTLKAESEAGFTQFVVPQLRTAGRIYLAGRKDAAASSPRP